jgi:integrase
LRPARDCLDPGASRLDRQALPAHFVARGERRNAKGTAIRMMTPKPTGPTKVVQELLGHSSAMVTLDIYSHVTATLKSDASQLVADPVTGKR